jgi:hypothetical protein
MRRGTKEEGQQIVRRPFALTRQLAGAGRRPPRRVVVGETEGGREVLVFDVSLYKGTTGSDGGMVFSHYSAAAVRLDRRIEGRAVLARKGLLRAPVKPDLPAVGTLGRHRLYASSPELAHDLAPLEEWLARQGCHFEIVHDHVLAYGRRRLLTPRAALIKAAEGLAARLPQAAQAVPLRRAA